MSHWKRNVLFFFSFAVIVTAVFLYFYIEVSDNLQMLEGVYIEDVDLSTIPDGSYYGEYEMFPVIVQLSVTVENHEITAINIARHVNGKGEAAETIVDDVIAGQTLQVDSVAGATYSSKVILLAIRNALLNASE